MLFLIVAIRIRLFAVRKCLQVNCFKNDPQSVRNIYKDTKLGLISF